MGVAHATLVSFTQDVDFCQGELTALTTSPLYHFSTTGPFPLAKLLFKIKFQKSSMAKAGTVQLEII